MHEKNIESSDKTNYKYVFVQHSVKYKIFELLHKFKYFIECVS